MCSNELCSVSFPWCGGKWLHFFLNTFLCYFHQKMLHENKAQTCITFLVCVFCFCFVFCFFFFFYAAYNLWDVIPTMFSCRLWKSRTEGMLVRPVFKEKILSLLNADQHRDCWIHELLKKGLHVITQLTRKQETWLSVP